MGNWFQNAKLTLFFVFAEKAHARALRSESDGRADSERHHAVLCLCAGATKGPLPQHSLLQVTGNDFQFDCNAFGSGQEVADKMVKHLIFLGQY